jgi:hypothetical protein
VNKNTISNPAAWHRRICIVHGRLVVTGDLDSERTPALAQLGEWIDAGVTDIVDVRGEWSDEPLVSEHAPEIRYHWFGTDDLGTARANSWFDGVLGSLGDAIDDEHARILVHCHMGVNRGPSMALRILLEQGWDVLDALDAIRAARPIAKVLYADSAVEHYHRCKGSSAVERIDDLRRVGIWHDTNPIDVGWIISNIRHPKNEDTD